MGCFSTIYDGSCCFEPDFAKRFGRTTGVDNSSVEVPASWARQFATACNGEQYSLDETDGCK